MLSKHQASVAKIKDDRFDFVNEEKIFSYQHKEFDFLSTDVVPNRNIVQICWVSCRSRAERSRWVLYCFSFARRKETEVFWFSSTGNEKTKSNLRWTWFFLRQNERALNRATTFDLSVRCRMPENIRSTSKYQTEFRNLLVKEKKNFFFIDGRRKLVFFPLTENGQLILIENRIGEFFVSTEILFV